MDHKTWQLETRERAALEVALIAYLSKFPDFFEEISDFAPGASRQGTSPSGAAVGR